MSVDYIDVDADFKPTGRITAAKQTKTPVSRSVSDYGSKLPTSYMVQIDGKRWHRVYCIRYSNAGSIFVIVNNERRFILYETEIQILADKKP